MHNHVNDCTPVLDAEKTVLPLQRMIDGQTPGNTVGSKDRKLSNGRYF